VLIATDVAYDETHGTALAAGIAFDGWAARRGARTYTVPIAGIAGYEPGAFYKRELPCLLALIGAIDGPIDAVIVDGHTWLQADRPGLGHYLYEALDARVPVVGVAKRAFHRGIAEPVLRGHSRQPLYVTADGLGVAEACDGLRAMAGPHRIPALLQQVDALSRGR
jgi:deoxyribonuclease V